ncbi:VCBS repeat-containing protein [Mucilaginibacter gilvus]|uniref:RNA-binding protein n=1 Tax=Mucilaginibacter gilvus TaxID=2305909 RepID=A0A444MIX9_9SPHI|nr:VCBS repeat-containing protein [Mucilaginibacter gilvus]RWY48047.1 RNA-binding protein [Mucilaginibacter gilvus]
MHYCFFGIIKKGLLLTLTTLAIPCIVLHAQAQQTLFNLLPAAQTGITFRNDLKEDERLNVLSYEYLYNGGGVAVGDINNDGLQDLLFTSNMGQNKLYLNLGGLKFKDITSEAASGLSGRAGAWKTGATMADVNGDGLLDIYICYSGLGQNDIRRNQLFINKGKNKFVEKAKEYGLDDPGYSTQAAFFDYNNDGKMDMFLLNHNVKKINNIELAQAKNQTDELASNKLFENQGGHFVDVSKKAGIIQNPLTFGLGIALADINKDGLTDIYVTNDYNEPDYIYINKGDGTFSEQSQKMLRHLSQFSMGVDIADINNDGLPDIITLDMLPPDNRRQKLLQLQENYETFELMLNQGLYKQYMRNMLQLNNGDGTFSEIGQLAGLSNTDWSWCPLIADFDNDGYKDIFISNGYLRDYTNKDFLRYWGDYKMKKAMDREPALLMDLVQAMPSTTLSNYIFKNNHNLNFTDKKQDWGINNPGISSGSAYADLDNDGDLDIITNNINNVASIFKNTSRDAAATNYIAINLVTANGKVIATGAKVYVYTGKAVQYQELNPNRGYLSCVSTVLNFGLGDVQTVDSVKVTWPGNNTQVLTNVKANQRLNLVYSDAGKRANISTSVPQKRSFSKVKAPIDYTNTANTINDFKRQPLMLFMASKIGPVIAKADVNKDGLEDIFIGDGTAGKLYLQTKTGTWAVKEIADLNAENTSAAAFFDANGDGFPDLYIAKGGYALLEPGSTELQDKLYLNDGKGNFTFSSVALPVLNASSKSCVRPCDYNNDGKIDLFVGGRIVPGQYPITPRSYLLNNNGDGTFTTIPAPFSKAGMVTDAQWADLNGDGRQDLVICGEMMPILVYINTKTGFEDKTADYFAKPESGFWNSISLTDVDGDSKLDIIAGNLGTNTQIQTSETQPAEMYFADFDNNGSIDPFLNFYVQGVSYPFVSREELNDQIFPMRRKFRSYKDYCDATMKELFTHEELAKATKLIAANVETTLFLNQNKKFMKSEIPIEAQFSSVSQILTGDFNHDGKTDLLLFGNHTDNRLKLGSFDANYGCLLIGDGKGSFVYQTQVASGLSTDGDVKSASEIKISGIKYLMLGVSNQPLQFYQEN